MQYNFSNFLPLEWLHTKQPFVIDHKKCLQDKTISSGIGDFFAKRIQKIKEESKWENPAIITAFPNETAEYAQLIAQKLNDPLISFHPKNNTLNLQGKHVVYLRKAVTANPLPYEQLMKTELKASSVHVLSVISYGHGHNSPNVLISLDDIHDVVVKGRIDPFHDKETRRIFRKYVYKLSPDYEKEMAARN